jgi:hypothetical protein
MRHFFIFIFSCFLAAQPVKAQQLKKIASLPTEIKESSGLVAYTDTSFLTINDSGNLPVVVEIAKSGQIRSITSFASYVHNYDWEELTMDDKGFVYIGDIGNNLNQCNKLTIYKFPLSAIGKNLVEPEVIDFHYPEQKSFPPEPSELHYDAEAFLVLNEEIIIFTKCRAVPFSGQTRIYAIPNKPGRHVAQWVNTVVIGTQSWREHSVTGVCRYNSGIAILTYSAWHEVKLFDPRAKFWVNGKVIKNTLPFYRQREAITQGKDGFLYITDENMPFMGGGNLYQWIGKKPK